MGGLWGMGGPMGGGGEVPVLAELILQTRWAGVVETQAPWEARRLSRWLRRFGGFGGMGQSRPFRTARLSLQTFSTSLDVECLHVATCFETGVNVSPGLAQFAEDEVVNVNATQTS